MVRTCTLRALSILPITMMMVLPLLSPLRAQAQIDRAHVPGEVILKFTSDATQADVVEVIDALQAVQEEPLSWIRAGLYRIQVPVEDAVANWANHPAIEFIEPNYIWYADETPNDPSFGQLWGLHNTGQTGGTPGADIHATQAWDVFTGNADVVVGVIDTGVDITHPDLAANIYTNPGEIPGNGIDDDNNGFIDDVHGWDFANDDNDPFDDVGHGTHVAGTIGAVGDNGIGVVGVNWDVTIMPIKFLAPGGGTTVDAVASVEYATLMGVHLTNNSWGGGGYSAALEAAIDAAGQAGILFVAAAGNSATDTDFSPHYPSSYDLPSIVSVAATDHDDQLAWFSNYGVVSVDLAAPGEAIFSTIPNASYGLSDGTSMASPHVAGVLALLKGRNPGMPAASMRDFLLLNVDPLPSLAGRVATGGRLNAFAALAEPDSILPGPVVDLEVLEVTSANGIRLRWTATGDDGSDGTASYYDVRFSTAPIDELNFSLATPAANAPDPAPSGSVEEFVVEGVDFDTNYHLALKVLDEFGNASLLSNVVQATTLPPPVIVVSPLALSESLLTGGSSTQPLTIQNVGSSDLAFSISVTDDVAPSSSPESLHENYPEVMVPVTSATGAAYDGGASSPKPRTWPAPDTLAPTSTGAWNVLIVHAGNVSEIQAALLQFTDIDVVDAFDGGVATPTVADLLAYSAVIVAPNSRLADAVSLGDNLADYVDAGGGVILTTPSHVSGWEVTGRFLSDGYSPFEIGSGPIGSGGLASFDANHPIMDGVTTATGDLLATTPLAAGAQWVADWSIGEAFVATQGDHVVGVNVFVGGPGAWTGDVPLVLRNAVGWASTIPWLTVIPDAGSVPAGGSTVLDVNFDALGLIGGAYDKTIRVASNDPTQTDVPVPVHLDVTGAPDILVDPVALDYGVVFVGLAAQQTLSVCNPGTDLLQVSSITSDSPDFLADLSSFDLAPGACQDVVVTFSPAAVGPHAGTLTLSSNDPDEGQVMVTLSGEGAECPVITVSPTEIVSNLLTNDVEVQTLEIGNTGGSDLDFTVRIQMPTAQLVTLTAPETSATGFDGEIAPLEEARTVPLEATLADLSGMDILWDLSRGQPSVFNGWSVLVTDLTARGAVVTENSVPITPAVLSNFDVMWSADTASTWSAAEIAAIVSWVLSGGSLLLEGDNDATVVAFNALLGAAGAGIVLSNADGASGITSLIEPHPTTENVQSIYLDANIAHISSIVAPGGPLVHDVAGVPASAYAEVGAGQILVVTDEVFADYRSGLADNQLWGNQVFDWFQTPPWLQVQPTEGTVPPQGTSSLAVTLDATGLFGGQYELEVSILSNDCLDPEWIVPVTLNVTGRPDLTVSETQIDFGTVFLGGASEQTLVVSNAGTDLLTVTSLIVDDPAFVLDTTPFDLPPRESRDLVVAYTPLLLGPASASLTLESNDPDGPVVVGFEGTAIEPPDIEVDPTSLSESLFTEETSTQILTISNVGTSPLDFRLATEQLLLPTQGAVSKAATGARTRTTSSVPTSLQEYALTDSRQRNQLTEQDSPVMGAMATFGTTPEAILLYADDYRSVPGQQKSDLALQNLGLAYTAFYSDVQGFTNAVATGTWDLVVIDNNNYFFQPTDWDVVEQYVLGGGRVLISTFDLGRSAPFTSLWTTLGVDFRQENFSALPVFWWTSTHQIFSHPESVPEFLVMGDYYADNGDRVDPIAPAVAVAGFTATASPAQGAIVLSDTKAAVVNSFLVVENDSDLDQDGMLDAVELFVNEITYLLRSASWLDVDPAEGALLPAESIDIQVTFDARGLFGGMYDADIVIDSNDPDEPQLRVPAHLQVTGRPSLAVSDSALAFGPIFVGLAESRALTLSNVGTDLLIVSAITSDEADFTVDPITLDLAPGESQDVMVTFAPSRLGAIAGTLSIASNDPLVPVAQVSLSGEGVAPPDIAVSPAAFDVSLSAGETTTRVLLLQNEGASDLVFDLGAELHAPAGTVPESSAPPVGAVLLRDGFEDGDFSGWVVAGTGGVKEVTSATAAAGTQFSYHESLSTVGHSNGIYHTMGPGQPQYISFWIRSGSTVTNDGYFVVRGSGGDLLMIFYARSDGLLAVNTASPGGGTYPYVANTWYHIELQEIDFAGKTFDFHVDGQLVHPGVSFRDSTVEDVARVDLYNHTANSQAWWDEIEFSVTWLGLAPTSGTIPPGGAMEVVTTFLAEDLGVGVYDATILVHSNDPDEPEVPVPAHMEVLPPSGCDEGDVIADGEINSADALRGLLLAMDLIVPTPQELCAADMNGDGVIEVGDVVLILQAAVGSIPALSQNPARLFARAGDEIGTVILRMEGAAGLDLVMTYDPAAVSFVSFSAPGSSGITAGNDQQPGTLRVGFARDALYEGDLVLKFDVTDPHSALRFEEAVAFDGSGAGRAMELPANEFIFGVTGVDVPSLGATRLLPAVPNPFNPTTQLRFVLSAPGDAALTIFNLAGRKVRGFALPGLAAGEHFVTWDGRDDAGAPVGSGTYLIRFQAANTTDTGRVLLLK